MDEKPPGLPDDEPPPEEIEMAVEDALGRPMAGNAAERIVALTNRLVYLDKQINLAVTDADDAELRRLRAEREAAQKQLADWQHQNEGRN